MNSPLHCPLTLLQFSTLRYFSRPNGGAGPRAGCESSRLGSPAVPQATPLCADRPLRPRHGAQGSQRPATPPPPPPPVRPAGSGRPPRPVPAAASVSAPVREPRSTDTDTDTGDNRWLTGRLPEGDHIAETISALASDSRTLASSWVTSPEYTTRTVESTVICVCGLQLINLTTTKQGRRKKKHSMVGI